MRKGKERKNSLPFSGNGNTRILAWSDSSALQWNILLTSLANRNVQDNRKGDTIPSKTVVISEDGGRGLIRKNVLDHLCTGRILLVLCGIGIYGGLFYILLTFLISYVGLSNLQIAKIVRNKEAHQEIRQDKFIPSAGSGNFME